MFCTQESLDKPPSVSMVALSRGPAMFGLPAKVRTILQEKTHTAEEENLV
jgi:hypothetical protein